MKTKSIRRLDGQGRVILPSHIRRALDLTQNSAVSIEMVEGSIVITPAEECCCICGESVANRVHKTINGWNGPKHVCALCAVDIHEKGEWKG